MPSGCARLPSCRGRKGDGTGGTVKIVPAKAGAAGLAAAKAKEQAAKAAPVKTAPVKDVATSSSKKKGKGKGPPPAAAAFLAKKRAEEQAAAAAACASASDEASASAVQYESDSQSIDQAATVSFDTFDPAQDDFEGIQALLGDMIDADEFDAAGLVRLVLAEAGNVGMTIKIADEDEVRGVLSVVETTHASHPLCLKQLAAFVTDRAPAHLKEVFASAMAGKTGLIVSARDMSAPPELAVPLLQTLLDEIDAARHSPYEKLRAKYSFENYLVVTQALRPGTSAPDEAAGEESLGGHTHGGGGAEGWFGPMQRTRPLPVRHMLNLSSRDDLQRRTL